MLSYWETVRKEVINSSNENYPFHFTNMGYWQQKRKHSTASCIKIQQKKVAAPKYYLLNSDIGPIVLTRREAQCLYFLETGLNTPQISKKFLLSLRTVEYYTHNAKKKIGCRGRQNLTHCLNKTNFALAVCFKSELPN